MIDDDEFRAAYRRMIAADNLAAIKAETEFCTCGHLKSAHIYHEGPCRPGFACGSECREFTLRTA